MKLMMGNRQASATLFPTGWNMRKHIGKAVSWIQTCSYDTAPQWKGSFTRPSSMPRQLSQQPTNTYF